MRNTLLSLYSGNTLDYESAYRAMLSLSQGGIPPAQVASFLTVYNMRLPSVDELAGFRDALLSLAKPCEISSFSPVDLCGTGGDGKHTFNISTTAAFLVAACGVPVAKHGNYGVTSSVGSSNLLEALRIPLPQDEGDARSLLKEYSIVFLHAPYWHPAMKNLASIRKELGVKTIFNLLGPLVNPARTSRGIVGVSTPEIFTLYHALLTRDGTTSAVIYSKDGYDEISLTGEALIGLQGHTQTISPATFSCNQLSPEDLRGAQSPTDAAALTSRILQGKGTPAQASVVAANAAMVLHTVDMHSSLKTHFQHALHILSSGAPFTLLSRLQSRK